MKVKTQVAASILNANNKKESVRKLINKGIKWIHYDVMDGEFVDNYQMPLLDCEKIINNNKPHIRDFHFMVNTPYEHIAQFLELGNYFTFHFESVNKYSIDRIFNDFEDINVGIAINPDTHVSEIKPYLEKASHILVMSVVPGKGGQTFIDSSLKKISALSLIRKKEKLNFLIGVDGGINNVTAPLVNKEGVDYLVSGSYLLNNLDQKTIHKLTTI